MNPATHITLYTRKGCHLCIDAEALLRRLGVAQAVVDIDQDRELQARYTDLVPAVVVNGDILLSGVITEVQARLALASYLG